MQKLNNEEMLKVKGGGISSKLIWGLVGGAIVFLIGLFDGIISPKKCN